MISVVMSIIEYGQEEHGGKKDFPGEMNTRWGTEGRVGSWQAVRSWQLYGRDDLVKVKGQSVKCREEEMV